MNAALTALLVIGAAASAAAALRGAVRRWRTVRRLERVETEVAAAVAEGRLGRPTGEALLQHLEGLRRSIAGGRES